MRVLCGAVLLVGLVAMPASADAAQLRFRAAPGAVTSRHTHGACPRAHDMQLDKITVDGHALSMTDEAGPTARTYGYGLVVWVSSQPGRRDRFRVANATGHARRIVIHWHYVKQLGNAKRRR